MNSLIAEKSNFYSYFLLFSPFPLKVINFICFWLIFLLFLFERYVMHYYVPKLIIHIISFVAKVKMVVHLDLLALNWQRVKKDHSSWCRSCRP